MTNKVILWAGGVIAALLVATIIVVVVLINTIRSEAENQQYQDCMARQGYGVDERAPAVSDEELDEYIGEMADAAEFCAR